MRFKATAPRPDMAGQLDITQLPIHGVNIIGIIIISVPLRYWETLINGLHCDKCPTVTETAKVLHINKILNHNHNWIQAVGFMQTPTWSFQDQSWPVGKFSSSFYTQKQWYESISICLFYCVVVSFSLRPKNRLCTYIYGTGDVGVTWSWYRSYWEQR